MPGNNYYRLYIVFESDLTWYANRVRLFVDSTQLMNRSVLPPNDSIQKMISKMPTDNEAAPDASSLMAYTYIRSQYVFTNPFTGHVNIELPDNHDKKSRYSVNFFDQKDQRVLQIAKVPEQTVIIDKHNFQRKGVFKFELRKDADLLETGYITIY